MTTDATGARGSPAVSDDVSARIEELQFTLGEGPCVDAVSLGRPVLADDLSRAEFLRRWPGFATGALAGGATAVFAFPLQVGAVRIGAFVAVPEHGGRTARRTDQHGTRGRRRGGAALLPAGADGDHRLDLGRRAVVHQATGMVSVQLGVTVDEAFVRLRAYAFAQERPVAEVSRDVVERRLRFDELKD